MRELVGDKESDRERERDKRKKKENFFTLFFYIMYAFSKIKNKSHHRSEAIFNNNTMGQTIININKNIKSFKGLSKI